MNPGRPTAALDRFFGLRAAGSSVPVEIRAGVTTFLTMAYVLFVNPTILAQAVVIPGVDVRGQLLVATALAAAVGTLMMGLWARYPFALAPGMGVNAYFTYSVVLGMGVPWQTALGAVFLSGVLFLILSLVGAREFVINAIPISLKTATAAGIGLFLAIIGCKNGGLIVAHPATLVTLGDLSHPAPLLTAAGLLLTAALLALRVRGGLLIGILAVTAAAILSGAAVFDGQAYQAPAGGFFQAPALPTDLFLALRPGDALGMGLVAVVFIFCFVDMFDTAGTLFGLSHRCGYTAADGTLTRANAAFACDAAATITGSLFGTSTTTTYIESASGIEDGGRTGLCAVVVALLFLLSIFASPLAGVVPAAATAPALIIVGASMMSSLGQVRWAEYREAVPAFLTAIVMPLSYSIANGIAFGIISHTVLHLTTGRHRQVHWLMVVLAALLVVRYAYLAAS